MLMRGRKVVPVMMGVLVWVVIAAHRGQLIRPTAPSPPNTKNHLGQFVFQSCALRVLQLLLVLPRTGTVHNRPESEWAPPDYVRESIKKFPFQIKGDHQNIEGGSI